MGATGGVLALPRRAARPGGLSLCAGGVSWSWPRLVSEVGCGAITAQVRAPGCHGWRVSSPSMTAADTDDFQAKGERLSKLRQDAFLSHSQAADLVRTRLQEWVEGSRAGQNQAMMDRLERELVAAERLKDLTVLTLQHADENWREWKEELARRRGEERWHHEQEGLARQAKTTTSARSAAWGSCLAALLTAVVAVARCASEPARRESAGLPGSTWQSGAQVAADAGNGGASRAPQDAQRAPVAPSLPLPGREAPRGAGALR